MIVYFRIERETKLTRLLKQAIKFFGLSGIGWSLDFTVYAAMGFLCRNVIINNVVSSWVGVTFVFSFATRKVFKNNSRISLKWKYLVYLSYQLILILLISRLLGYVNTLIINTISSALIVKFSAIVAKILVTPITMVMNFIVMKNIIEKL